MLQPIALSSLFSTLHSRPFSRVLDASDAFPLLLDAFHDRSHVLAPYHFGSTEDGKAYEVAIELPGYKRDQVTVEVDDDLLRVHASRPSGKVNGIEYAHGTNVPAIPFPHDADSTKVAAKLEDGILTVTVPKVATPAPRKVVVT